MSWGRIVILDSELDVKVFEFLVFELFSIIRYQRFWDLEPTNYGSPNEVTYLLLDDCCQWLSLDPFNEVVQSHNSEFGLTPSNVQGPEYI